LKAYGSEIDLVSTPDPNTKEFLAARITRVRQLLCIYRKSFWTNQYANEFNSLAHHQTMYEIISSLEDKVDYLFCATSSCGTLRGCAEYVRSHGLKTKIIAVDALGSLIFGNKKANRLIPGLGAGIKPPLYQADFADDFIHVSDMDCVVGCRRLLRQEAILSGGSSGGVIMAIERIKSSIPNDATCVGIFPDRGERYLDTIYSDSWVKENIGNLSDFVEYSR
jgi:cysteine synthase A